MEISGLMGGPPQAGLSPHPSLFFPTMPLFLSPQHHPALWPEHAKQLPISP